MTYVSSVGVTFKRLNDGCQEKGSREESSCECDMADAHQDSDVSDRSHSLSQFSCAVYLYDPKR